ncbi:hypothetical protein TIFTF001_023161 [Ficus carica]|uniref:Retrotransposon gag domain-containing protein n=1 Tax=Ficus carica TaxID=3494 RepID=A0AA88AE42_FICCA|nr:hypothetical protein TIFTF001_023161 [Ficus carica]
MRLTEQEKVICASFALKNDARHWWMTVQMRRDVMAMSWQNFVAEFRTMYYNREILAAQQDEFTSLKQGTMTVRRMMKMFRKDIAKQVGVGSSPPTLVSDCVSQAIRAEYWINQDKETSNSAQGSKQLGRNKRKENVTGQGQQRNYPQKKSNRENEGNNNEYPVCAQYGKKHLGVCRLGLNACYLCGKEGH